MGVVEKLGNFLFGPVEEEEDVFVEDTKKTRKKEPRVKEEKIIDEPKSRNIWSEPEVPKTRKGQLVDIPMGGNKGMEMILLKAKEYKETEAIAIHIRNRKVVVLNVEDLDSESAQRMVDFLSGAVFALGGRTNKVSGATFVFSSSQVELEGEIESARKESPEFAAFTHADFNRR